MSEKPPPPEEIPTVEEPDGEADAKFAGLIRQQWSDYQKMYFPIEDDLGNRLTDDDYGEDILNRNVGIARIGQLNAAEQSLRDVERYGIDRTQRQRQEAARGLQLGSEAAGIGAYNTGKPALNDTQMGALKDFTGIGHGVQTQATSGLGAAAQMGIQRNAAAQQYNMQVGLANHQNQQQYNLQMAQIDAMQRQQGGSGGMGSMLGLAGGIAGTAFGGPIGGAVGSVLGGVLGGLF